MPRAGRPLTWSLCLLFLLIVYGGSEADTLVIGRVADDPTKYYKVLKPLLDYVVSHSHDLGVTGGSVTMTKNIEETVQLLKAGKVDWVTTGIVGALIYSEKTGAEIPLRTWRDGAPVYRTVFFTRHDSPIHSLGDLKGKRIAFQDPHSTTAYFIPLAILRGTGLRTVQLSSPKQKIAADEVGFVFAGNELNISTWVQRGLADVGAYNDQNWNNSQHNPDIIKKDLQIFYRHKELPRMVEVFRKELDGKIKSRIKEVLLNARDDAVGQQALKSYSNTAKFDEFKGEATEGLEETRQMLKYVRHEIH